MLGFFDSNCSVGRRDAPPRCSMRTVNELKNSMDVCNITRVLAYDVAGLEFHPTVGNQEICALARREERIYPMWLAMPNYTGEFMDPEELLNEMEKNGVRAVKLFPKYNSNTFSLSEWNSGELLSALEGVGVPVFIDLDQTDWDTIYSICKRYPGLNVVVTDVYYRYARYFYPLLKRLDNLYIETSRLKFYLSIEDICHKIGAEKLIFGTGMGIFDPGPAAAMILYAEISDTEKEMIASKNLERLLKLGEVAK